MSTNSNTMEPHIRKTVAEIDGDIASLQADIGRLTTTRTTLMDLYGGEEAEEAVATVQTIGTSAKRPYKKRGGQPRPAALDVRATGRVKATAAVGQSTEARLADEPETLGAAMKMIARQLGKFTADELRSAVKEKYQRLFEEVGPSAFGGNLKYWTSTGKLTLAGDTYTVANLDF